MLPLGSVFALAFLFPISITLVIGLAFWVKIKNGNLARNPTVGIRTKETLKNDEAWKRGQQAGVRVFAFGGTPVGVVAILLLLWVFAAGSSSVLFPVVILSVWTVSYLAVAIFGVIEANKAAKKAEIDDGKKDI